MNDYKTNPVDIPDVGERLDQTILDVGLGKSWHKEKDERQSAIIVRTIVDNGKRIKKKLSAPFFRADRDRYEELCGVVGIDLPVGNNLPTRDKDAIRDYLLPLHNKIREARFSSMVRPIEFETDRGRYVRYQMTFFDDPNEDSNLNLRSKPTQFER